MSQQNGQNVAQSDGETRGAREGHELERQNRSFLQRMARIGRRTPDDEQILEAKKAAGPQVVQKVGESKQASLDDAFGHLVSIGRIVEPPFDPLVLAMLPEHSSELLPCLDAMTTNVAGFGWKLESKVRDDDQSVPEYVREAAKREYVSAWNFLSNCVLDPDGEVGNCLDGLLQSIVRTQETNGGDFTEVIRSPLTGKVQMLHPLKVYEMRIARMDLAPTPTLIPKALLRPDGGWSIEFFEMPVRYRRYVQVVGGYAPAGATGYAQRWFKAFGDPRIIDSRTGDVADERLPQYLRANEVIHWRLGLSKRTPYDLPRIVGAFPSIFGDRAADEINYTTLRNNNIPSLAVLVSGGQATKGTLKRIKTFVDEVIEGSGNYSRILLLEAEPAGEEGLDTGAAKVDIKPLVDAQTRDAMFQNYQESNGQRVRRMFRLPPIYTGRADDYSKATAESSLRLGEQQIFAPRRAAIERVFNAEIFPRMGIRYHNFRLLGPNVTDDQRLVEILNVAERTGGMDPTLAREIIGDVLNKKLPPVTGIRPREPFSMQMAERVKNQAEMHPGTQLTALKAEQDDERAGLLRLAERIETADLGSDARAVQLLIAQKIRDHLQG